MNNNSNNSNLQCIPLCGIGMYPPSMIVEPCRLTFLDDEELYSFDEIEECIYCGKSGLRKRNQARMTSVEISLNVSDSLRMLKFQEDLRSEANSHYSEASVSSLFADSSRNIVKGVMSLRDRHLFHTWHNRDLVDMHRVRLEWSWAYCTPVDPLFGLEGVNQSSFIHHPTVQISVVKITPLPPCYQVSRKRMCSPPSPPPTSQASTQTQMVSPPSAPPATKNSRTKTTQTKKNNTKAQQIGSITKRKKKISSRGMSQIKKKTPKIVSFSIGGGVDSSDDETGDITFGVIPE